MKFRNKILLAIWGVVLGLLLVTYVIINYWVRIQTRSRFMEDLRGNYSVLNEISALRLAQDLKACQVITETPRLKAIAELRDSNTTLQLSEELNRSMATDLFIMTDEQGHAVVQLVKGKPSEIPLSPGHQTVQPQPMGDVWSFGGNVFRTVTSPIFVGNDVVGSLTLGFVFSRGDVEFVKSMTNSEVVLVAGDSVIISTLPSGQDLGHLIWWIREELGKHIPGYVPLTPEIITIESPGETFVSNLFRLSRKTSRSPSFIGYLLMKPVEKEVQAALEPVIKTFALVSLIVLIITAGIGYLISQGITRPISALVNGTTEISRGNYDYRISVRTSGELKYLAQQFGEMSKTLKEKIRLLAERNVELERALHQLKATEDELVKSERMAAMGKLTAQLSHEINNPIHNIQSCLQTALKRSSSTDPDRELLEVAVEEVERLSRLTRQMLDSYRSSMIEEEREAISVNALVREVILSSQTALQQSNVHVHTEYDDEAPPIVGSRDKLKQVFLNLFINAKDAMPNGGVLGIHTRRQEGKVVVTVSDNGIGISPDNINKIFDAFFSTKSKVSGVGLGLSVTYGIVRQHNGTISVQSKVGEGTTFTLSLPISPQHT